MEQWPGLIEDLQETQSTEYKSGRPFPEIKHKVLRGVLAMSNTEDGGVLVVGVDDNDGVRAATGISPEYMRTYNLQTIESELASYGYPEPIVQVIQLQHHEMEFLVLQVRGLQDQPTYCIRSCLPQGGVRNGCVYYRTETKESRRAQKEDWQAIMSTVRRKIRSDFLSEWSGVDGCKLSAMTSTPIVRDDRQKFKDERADL